MHNKLNSDKTTPMCLLLVWISLIGYKSACYDDTHTQQIIPLIIHKGQD